MKRRVLCIFLAVVLLMSIFPINIFAAHDSTGKPLDLTGDVYLALYVGGSNFPGEPAEHAVSGYLNLNASFGSSGFGKFAESAQNILEPSILKDVVQGTSGVWGVFSTTGGSRYLLPSSGIVDGTAGDVNKPHNEETEKKIIQTAINNGSFRLGSGESIDDYTSVWYVIKYQRSDSAWHIDGLITKKSTFSVNYYGNGNTSGGAPTGESGLKSGDVHTVLGNTGGLRKIVGKDTYIFNGWNTSSDGTGTHYDAGDKITIENTNVTLYAEWYLQNKYTATVVTKLDGAETNVEDILGVGISLHLEFQSDGYGTGEYIPLSKTTAGTYTTTVTENGAYYIWRQDATGEYQKVEGYQITIYNQNGRAELQYYSVSYDTNAGPDTVTWEGQPAPIITNYPVTTPVTDKGGTPVREGYTFLYWLDQDNNRIYPGQTITSSLTEKTVLTAQWKENIDVTVEIIIDHNGGDGFNNAENRHEALLQFLRVENGINLPLDQIQLDKSHTSFSYDEVNHKTTYTLTFQNLPQAIYNLSTQKPLYDVTVTHTGEADQDQHVRVEFKYAPENFDLTFDVVVNWDDEAEKKLLPVAVNVKVLYWGYNNAGELGWHTITQQAGNGAPTTVYIDPETGTGTGFYPVWKYWDNETVQDNYAYEYRIEVTSFVMPDGQVIPASGDLNTYIPNGSGLYEATISVENGGRKPIQPQSHKLPGAYYDGADQNGIPTATIDIWPYSVYFYAADAGKLENKQQLVLNNQYRYPDLNQYVPVPNNSNYIFIGWYDRNGNPMQNLAGAYLTDDVHYYAKYSQPISVQGTITVAGTYLQNGETVTIKEVDRANKVMVVLQKNINGQYMDVASYEANITYESLGADGRGDYNFTDIVQDGAEYRIIVLGRNYEASFDNESDAGISYSPDENIAVLGGDYIATVYAYLEHAPESYEQKMEVDASQISQAYRPTSALAEILYRDLGDIHPYGVISQHTVDPYGVKIDLSTKGFGNGTEYVWQYHTDGTLYEYQMNLTKLYGNVTGVFTPDGTVYNSDTAPFIIEYDPAARYSAANGGQSHTLKATLIPKEYEIIFDMGLGENETVQGMDAYLTDGIDGTDYYSYLHTWSYEDSITAFPYREGYVFVRWESSSDAVKVLEQDGGSIVVAEGLASDVTLTAVWRKLEGTTYTVRHLELNTEKPLRGAEVGENLAIGSQISATEWVQNIQGYNYAGAKIGNKMYSLTEHAVLTITEDPTKNVLTLYYVKDGYTDQVESNLNLDKTVILTNNGTYTINLETYTMDNPVTTMILQNTPLDIVLVLDQSGSIVQNGYLDELQAAVDNFVELIADHGRHNEVDHRIAIVGYASNATAGATDSDTKEYPLAGGSLNEWVNTGVFDSNGDFHPYPVTGFAYQEYTGAVDPEKEIYYTRSEAHNDAFLLLSYHEEYRHLITEAEAREAVLNGTKVYGYVYDQYDIGGFVELTRNASGLWLYGDKQLYSAKEFFTYHTDVWTHRHGLEAREIHAYGTGSNYRTVDGHSTLFTRQQTEGNEAYKLNIYEDALMPVSVGANGSGGTNPNLLKATQRLGSNGGTYVQYGMEMANKIFEANDADGRVRIVVTFTDGQPGNSGFDKNVANAAINEAYITKHTHKAHVFTVGLYSSNGVDSLSDIAVYMNAMSSNYPNAKQMDDIYSEGGYTAAKDGSKLNDGDTYYALYRGSYYLLKYGKYSNWLSSQAWYYTRNGNNTVVSRESAPVVKNGKISGTSIYTYQPGGYAETPNTGYYSTTESEQKLKEYFANIMTEITTNITTEVVLHGDTILRDIMGQGLVLTPNTVITAYKVAGHYNAATGQIEWSATKEKVADLVLKNFAGPEVSSEETTDVTFTNEDGTVTTREDVPYITVFNYSPNVNKTDADKPHAVDITGYDFENNYIKDGHDGYKMVIEITSVEARDDVQWGRSTATNHERSGLWLPADESGSRQLLMAFNQPTTIFVERAYVLDYGKEFVLSDWYFDDEDGKDATPIHLDFDINNGMNGFDVNNPNLKNTKDSVYGNAQYGNVRIENGKVIYTPTSMNWGGYDSFYVFGNTWRKTVLAQDANQNGNLWNKVTVIPANNIYYEDSFITTESTTQNSIEGFTFTGAWSVVGEDGNNTEIPEHLESAPYGDVHGWTDSLGDDVTFTDGSAHFTNTPGTSAQFTFTGTGVEVYTRTNADSGMVVAVLNSKTVGEDGKEVITLYKSLAMDNLAVSGDYYHIPTVAFKDLPYGTYSLQLIATVATGDDLGMRYEYYIDGVRIHNPLGNTTNYYSSTVKDAYELENNAVFTEVRDILIDKNNSINADQPNIGGAVFIDQIKEGQGDAGDQAGVGVSTYVIGTFEAYGPKNEVYLRAGQAIVLKVAEGNTYYMGLKSLTGGAVTANVSGIDQTLSPTAITITHSTDMYYRINPVDGYIVIQNGNTDGAILSVTNLRTTNMREPVANGGIIPVAPQMAVMMMRSFSARLLEQENDPNPDGPAEETPKSPVQIHTEETLAFAGTLFLSVRQWLDEN